MAQPGRTGQGGGRFEGLRNSSPGKTKQGSMRLGTKQKNETWFDWVSTFNGSIWNKQDSIAPIHILG